MKPEPRWQTDTTLLAIHAQQIERRGGEHGVRDQHMVLSALARPKQRWHYDASADLADVAALYLVGLPQAQGFVDGNKRTGLARALVFLALSPPRPAESPRPRSRCASDHAAPRVRRRRAVFRAAAECRCGRWGACGPWRITLGDTECDTLLSHVRPLNPTSPPISTPTRPASSRISTTCPFFSAPRL